MTLREALDHLQAAGRIGSSWLPGMQYHSSDGCSPIRPDVHPRHRPRCAEPVLSDPATAGCLQALAREASGGVSGEAWAAALIGLAEGG